MAKQDIIDTMKTIGTIAYELGVPERWLRNKVANGEIASRRIGYNVLVPITETDKIKKLAQLRRK